MDVSLRSRTTLSKIETILVNDKKSKSSGWRGWARCASASLCLAVSTIQLVQLDLLAAVNLIPAWFWLLIGVPLACLGFTRDRRRLSVLVFCLWGVFTVLLVEETQSLFRFHGTNSQAWKNARKQGTGVRVVSLNCGTGNSASTDEVVKWKPDIVLLQESPSRQHVRRIARELFGELGSFVYSSDTSLIARGPIEPSKVDRDSHFVHAKAMLASGIEIEVVSLRLSPPVFRMDPWSPGFWTEHRDKRKKHRVQIEKIVDRIDLFSKTGLVVVGGDFNTLPNDAALSPLKNRLVDTFAEAGQGWGGTGTNEYPLFRVDQIWVSNSFDVNSATSNKTLHSDHRMVVCELMIAESD